MKQTDITFKPSDAPADLENLLRSLIRELRAWAKAPTLSEFPYLGVIHAYRQTGKHFVSPMLLATLDGMRAALTELEPTKAAKLRVFLDMLLDKHDGRYNYHSYIALDLLPLPSETLLLEESIDAQALLDRSVVLLGLDLARFEIAALEGRETWLPKLTVDQYTVDKRCLRALKALQPYLQRMGLQGLSNINTPVHSTKTLCDATSLMLHEDEIFYLNVSNVPVYVIHDEYMFIRILQIFETVFAWMTAKVRLAVKIGSDKIERAVHCLEDCSLHLHEVMPFFHVLSTLRVDAFSNFRTYTEGASAIQSRSYKRLESLCSRPSEERLQSIAYDSVPDVQRQVMACGETLSDLYLAARALGLHDTFAVARLGDVMQKFENLLLQWRRTHYGIAVRMLGKGTGTGYTAGTPYLDEVRHLPVFTALGMRVN